MKRDWQSCKTAARWFVLIFISVFFLTSLAYPQVTDSDSDTGMPACAVWKFSGKGYGSAPLPTSGEALEIAPWWCEPCHRWDNSGKWKEIQAEWPGVEFNKIDIPFDKIDELFDLHRIDDGVPHIKIWVKKNRTWEVPPDGRLYGAELFGFEPLYDDNGEPVRDDLGRRLGADNMPSTKKISELLTLHCSMPLGTVPAPYEPNPDDLIADYPYPSPLPEPNTGDEIIDYPYPSAPPELYTGDEIVDYPYPSALPDPVVGDDPSAPLI